MAKTLLKGVKSIWRTKLTDTASMDLEGVGTIRQEGDLWYRWVRNTHTSAIVAGQPVCYDVANGANMYEKVIQPTTATLNTFAGIAVGAPEAYAAAPTPTGNKQFFWIQIEGYNASVLVSIGKTSIAAGINFFPADTVDYLVGGAQQSVTVNSVSNQMVGRVQLAQTIASSATSGSEISAGTTAVGGFIHCLTV